MKYRVLGRTGLKVSAICLGTMQFGWSADLPTSMKIMSWAVDAGINFFDTADIYSKWIDGNDGGDSEVCIGRWLQKSGVRRQDLILATKVRGQMGESPTGQGLSRHHLMNAVNESLERLQTDYIDLYQVHWPDEETALEETLAALTDLVRLGKIRYVGCSNFPAWLLMKSLWVSDVHRLVRFETLQPHYNLVHRAEFERELAYLCADQRLGVMPYSPLAAGFLTGKYRRDQALPESARADSVRGRYMNDQGFAVLDVLREVAAARQATPAQVAVAWLLAHPLVTSTIVGANRVEQLADTVGAVEITLSVQEKEKLDTASDWRA